MRETITTEACLREFHTNAAWAWKVCQASVDSTCVYSPSERVGRAIRMALTAGSSKPSVSTCTTSAPQHQPVVDLWADSWSDEPAALLWVNSTAVILVTGI
jgi:hypothetical protein